MGVRRGGYLIGWKKVGCIRAIQVKWLKQLKAGIWNISPRENLIQSQTDRRLRTLCSTPFVRDSHFSSNFLSPNLSEMSSWGSIYWKTSTDRQLQVEPTFLETTMEIQWLARWGACLLGVYCSISSRLGVPNTSIAIDQLMTSVVWVHHMSLKK